MAATGEGPELLEAGPPPPSAGGRRRLLVVALALAVLLVGVVSVALVRRSQDLTDRPLPSPGPSSTAASRSPRPVSSTRRPQPTAPVVLRRNGPGIDGFGTGDLFVRSIDTVYRIGLGSGRITATPAPVGISAPVGFLPSSSGVILRPLDSVPGLLVPDDRPARELTGVLRRGIEVLPGPGDDVWVREPFDGRRSSAALVSTDGKTVRRAWRENGSFVPDGSSGLLLVDTGGVWERGERGWRRVSTGSVLATGPHHYLFATCDDAHACTTERYDRRNRERTRVPADQAQLFGGGGMLTSDGRYVAAMTYGPDGGGVAEVVDLSSGRVVCQLAEPSTSSDITSVAQWSPDGRRLVALEDSRLVVVDVPSGRRTAVDLDVDLPQLSGLTLRSR